MLLEDLKNEFLFDCNVRELTEKTCKNYEKQSRYLAVPDGHTNEIYKYASMMLLLL